MSQDTKTITDTLRVIIEIVHGRGWYKNHVGERYLAVVDFAGSKGNAKWRIDDEPIIEDGLLCRRYVRAEDCRTLED